jgi:hypothetical protein
MSIAPGHYHVKYHLMTWLRFEYLWQDSETYKRPTKMPAPQYIEHLMGWQDWYAQL